MIPQEDKSILVAARVLLIATAVWAALTGWAYIVPGGQELPQLSWIKVLIPGYVWGIAWIGAAGMTLSGLKFPRMVRYGLAAVAGLLVVWALSFSISWVADSGRAWVSAKNYAYLAVLVASSSVLLASKGKCGASDKQ